MIEFSYTNPDGSAAPGSQPIKRTLHLRHDPYTVEWTYGLNTQTYDTYGGQVVQVLSVNITNLIITGQLGREGAFGVTRAGNRPEKDNRFGGPVPAKGWNNRGVTNQFDYEGAGYPGLHGMVEFFREYFAIVTQGGDPQNPGRFIQVPMNLTYGGGPVHDNRQWIITPTAFPQFSRAVEEFAPEWRVDCSVVQADHQIQIQEKQAAIQRLQTAIGYTVKNPFSDPLADPSTDTSAITDQIVSQFKHMLPVITKGELESMVWQDISIPNAMGEPNLTTGLNQGEVLQGEVGTETTKTITHTTVVAGP